jgi:hypothetical protein
MRTWDRKDCESIEKFKLFALYRDYPEFRDLPNLSAACDKSVKALNLLKNKYDWEARASEFDEYYNLDAARETSKLIELENRLQTLYDAFIRRIDNLNDDTDKIKIEDLAKVINLINKTIAELKEDKSYDKIEKKDFCELVYSDSKAKEELYRIIALIDELKSK